MVHPPTDGRDDDDDFATVGQRDVDFDKMSQRRRQLMKTDWNEDTKKGEFT
jgi:hypothetical protein